MINRTTSGDLAAICDRLERLGIEPHSQLAPGEVAITDRRRFFRLVDILDKLIEIVERKP